MSMNGTRKDLHTAFYEGFQPYVSKAMNAISDAEELARRVMVEADPDSDSYYLAERLLGIHADRTNVPNATATEYLIAHGDRAPLIFCLDLMRGDQASFKRGYTRENAVLATKEAFGMFRSNVEALNKALDLEEASADE